MAAVLLNGSIDKSRAKAKNLLSVISQSLIFLCEACRSPAERGKTAERKDLFVDNDRKMETKPLLGPLQTAEIRDEWMAFDLTCHISASRRPPPTTIQKQQHFRNNAENQNPVVVI